MTQASKSVVEARALLSALREDVRKRQLAVYARADPVSLWAVAVAMVLSLADEVPNMSFAKAVSKGIFLNVDATSVDYPIPIISGMGLYELVCRLDVDESPRAIRPLAVALRGLLDWTARL